MIQNSEKSNNMCNYVAERGFVSFSYENILHRIIGWEIVVAFVP